MSTCRCCPKRLVSTAIAVVGTTLQVTIPETVLDFRTKYCLIPAQPVPEAGEALPVVILNGADTIDVERAPFGNLEFGEDLKKCCDRTRRRVPLYFNSAGRFSDISAVENLCFCREV